MIRKVVATFLAAMSLAAPALAAPDDGEHVDLATMDYSQKYFGIAVQYPRIIELQHSGELNGTLLATYECQTYGLREEGPGYNIHISQDGGSTWEMITTVREQEEGIYSKWQPFLYELPQQVGDMPEGTLLLAGCSIDGKNAEKTALRVYRSFDVGQTWEQYSTIVTAGGLNYGVWEPFLLVLPDGRLACYYADCTQREEHSQKLSMKISEDGVTWGEAMEIVALEDRELRPGMPTVAKMNDGRYIMTYEICHEQNSDYGNPVHYRFSTDGIHWGELTDPGVKLVTDQGAVPGSAPYIAYVPGYGENGLLLLTSVFQSPGTSKGNVVYINDKMGEPDAWKAWFLPERYRNKEGGYSHAIFPSADGRTAYFVNNIPDPASEAGYLKIIFVRYHFEDDFLAK